MLPCTAASSLDAVECSYRLRIRLAVGLGPNIDSSAAMVENPRTGERVEFLRDDGKVLEMELTWPRPGLRAAEHVHPEMEERYEVVAGRAAFRVGGVEREAGPGQVVVVPPGTAHLAWNPTDDEVRLRVEMRPPLRWRELVERLFAGEAPAVLLREYAREGRPPP